MLNRFLRVVRSTWQRETAGSSRLLGLRAQVEGRQGSLFPHSLSLASNKNGDVDARDGGGDGRFVRMRLVVYGRVDLDSDGNVPPRVMAFPPPSPPRLSGLKS